LASTCNELLALCLRGERWPSDLLERAIAEDEGRALLSIVVERLADLFEPRLCDTYAQLFTEVVRCAAPQLVPRTRRFRGRTPPLRRVQHVYVLSRVTLGADVAVTSVLLHAAKLRYPDAAIIFVGPRKNYELFEADPRIRHRDAPYARGGTLKDRLEASAALWFDDGIVIDPDSRLTQLGLIQVCRDDRYFFFESRSYGGETDVPLTLLAEHWAAEALDAIGAKAYIAPRPPAGPRPTITVSLGVGENEDKRLGESFEKDLLSLLASTGAPVLVDKGGTAEERARVERAVPRGMRTHEGAFAPFAADIARSRLFVGYDSAGGHAASASGVPLISIAQGFVNERMFQRWRPNGTIVRGAQPLEQVRRALEAAHL
jgi:ADP-heptose:LPS heptosyltransferase